ncbi:phosphotransferase [Altererythrobacter indicus]|uniref:Phosphotransferase n=1 Tax=Altericroceibacterium indicum TaxID=374177 RepID=A0A845AE74_9SPHN|nr:phosphotransferase [Altericroceibacterium indicum]MXP25468.1 phosphotransferase [Altericroceibacterium indicum]
MTSERPEGLDNFLQNAGWGGVAVEPLAGDASFRRYFRIRGGGRSAMLMYAPPPHEDPGPFLDVAQWLTQNGHRAPVIHAEARDEGYVLIEDFGDDRMRDWLDANPDAERAIYTKAIKALVKLRACPPGPFPPYDMATYSREVGLFTEWYCPAMGLDVDVQTYHDAWGKVLEPLLKRQDPGVTVLRDYHAENIMLLNVGQSADCAQGLIDFQDALVGHPAYDLVSLLQDARRDVSPELEREMLDFYCSQVDTGEDFLADYARLGAQRNAKIIGIFARLWKRDDKPRYLAFIPRVWEALERDLMHPALAPVAQWFDDNIPQNIRDTRGGELM